MNRLPDRGRCPLPPGPGGSTAQSNPVASVSQRPVASSSPRRPLGSVRPLTMRRIPGAASCHMTPIILRARPDAACGQRKEAVGPKASCAVRHHESGPQVPARGPTTGRLRSRLGRMARSRLRSFRVRSPSESEFFRRVLAIQITRTARDGGNVIALIPHEGGRLIR
jgi:hypothetical protein